MGRKLGAGHGRRLRAFLHPVGDLIEADRHDRGVGWVVAALERAVVLLQRATRHVLSAARLDAEDAVSGASDYLRLMGLVGLGFTWCRTALLASARTGEWFYRDKRTTARFFLERMLPQAGGLFEAVLAGGGSTMLMGEDGFARL